MAAEQAKARIFICSVGAPDPNICCGTAWHLQLNCLGAELHDRVISDRNQGSCRAQFPRWALRWGRDSENVMDREAKSMDKSPFAALPHPPPHLPAEPERMLRLFPPSPPASPKFLGVRYLLCSSDGHRGWGKAGGRLRPLFVLLFRSFLVLPTLQKKSESTGRQTFSLLRKAVVREKKGGCVGLDLQPYISYSSFLLHPATRAQYPSPTSQLLAGSVPLSLPQLQPTSGAHHVNRSPQISRW